MESNTVEWAIKQTQTQEQNKKEWASSVGLCQTQTVTSPPREGELAGTIPVVVVVASGCFEPGQPQRITSEVMPER